jgi:hypothetical protein
MQSWAKICGNGIDNVGHCATGSTTTLTLLKRNTEFDPLFLARLGIAAPAAEHESFVAASAASSLNAKTTAVFC